MSVVIALVVGEVLVIFDAVSLGLIIQRDVLDI